MKRLKVCFLISSLGKGGAERVCSIIANNFNKLGHSVSIVLTLEDEIVYKIDDGIKVDSLQLKTVLDGNKISRFFYRIKSIREHIATLKPDILISFMADNNIDASLAMLKLKIPLVVSERNDPHSLPKRRMKRVLRNCIYMRAQRIVVQTNNAKKYFSIFRNKTRVIFNPLSDSIRSYTRNKSENRIVSVSRLEPQKNLEMLLCVFKEFHEIFSGFTLEIYGEGSLKMVLQNWIKKNKMEEHIKLCGFSPHVHQKIVNASMFILPSNHEGMPNSLLEAMALGLPCISTDCPCGGPAEVIVNKRNGILIEVGDHQDLLKQMKYLIDNPAVAMKLGQEASKIIERLREDIIINHWMEMVQQVLNKWV